jgi:hypothetical protein
MSTLDTLGIVVGAIFVIFGIGFAIWFYLIRAQPDSQRPCNTDADCVNTGNPPSSAFGELVFKYPGEICVQGTCQPSRGASNQNCVNQYPGSTAYVPTSTPGSNTLDCVPVTCETTDDCLIPGTNADKSKVACVQSAGSGPGICVPTEVKNGERQVVSGTCFPDLTLQGGKCVIDQTTTPCQPGSFYDSENGSCFRCGDSPTGTCPTGTAARPLEFCNLGQTGACTENHTCSTTFSGGTLATLPDGSSLPSGIGVCLPDVSGGDQNDCLYNWFNISASPSGPNLGPGYCPSSQPYCTQSGPGARLTCSAIPNGALCNGVAGISNAQGGVFSRSGGSQNQYNLNGICDGILVPPGSFAAPAGFGVDGKPLPDPAGNNTTCNVGSDNPITSGCTCTPSQNRSDGSNSGCPLGTYCQKIGVVAEQNGSDTGLCMVARGTTGATGTAGTFVNAPKNGQLGHLYQNYFCAPPTNNSAGPYTCQPYPDPTNSQVFTSNLSRFTNLGGPGARCFTDTDCSLNFGPNTSGFGRLECVNNRCYGADSN